MTKNIQYESPLPEWVADSLPLRQLSSLYGHIVQKRNMAFNTNPEKIYRPEFPVISIGGIRAGGTGKTPSAMLIGRMLSEMNRDVIFLSRGYKRTNKDIFIAGPQDKVSWHDCGDEPAMLHEALPDSWLGIGADRSACAEKLGRMIPPDSVFVLDDGFQHRKMGRDLDIVCISESLFSDRLLPQGYLREPLSSLSRAQVAFITGSEKNINNMEALYRKLSIEFPHLDCYILTSEAIGWVNMASGEQRKDLPLQSPAAICGIARPERFFSTVRELGITPCREIPFSDHHRFTINDICNIHELYSNGLILTEKDSLRIREFSSEIYKKIWYLKIQLKFQTDQMFERFKEKLRFIISSTIVKGGTE